MKTKEQLRSEMRRRRRELPSAARTRASLSFVDAIVSIASDHRARITVAAYLATPDEIDLSPAISSLLARGTSVVVPRWNGSSYDLARLRSLSPEHLRRGPMGIWEPCDADFVSPQDVSVWLVPGLAFTRAGGRLGSGGGWYDRFLAAARPDALKLGVAHDFQILDELPLEPHDIRMNEILSEGRHSMLLKKSYRR